ncbi:hypothetical protein SAMN04488038_107158 [Solimonas aquatica]|uniref:Uncharacterized protein n=1 Tax=Solimonas aquatica TaxID=489703 RepID=A0A1H9GPY6_9GAMM|nr:hypothetical protein [Solimonas aquatica]SEQ52131.1 hypothetical protein SAMN04488038_107158 [Solimonas aquatica]
MNTRSGDTPAIPRLDGLPQAVGATVLIHEDGEFRVYATELEMLLRWDLFQGDRHLHTGSALRVESCIVSAKGKIGFFRRPTVARLIAAGDEASPNDPS